MGTVVWCCWHRGVGIWDGYYCMVLLAQRCRDRGWVWLYGVVGIGVGILGLVYGVVGIGAAIWDIYYVLLYGWADGLHMGRRQQIPYGDITSQLKESIIQPGLAPPMLTVQIVLKMIHHLVTGNNWLTLWASSAYVVTTYRESVDVNQTFQAGYFNCACVKQSACNWTQTTHCPVGSIPSVLSWYISHPL